MCDSQATLTSLEKASLKLTTLLFFPLSSANRGRGQGLGGDACAPAGGKQTERAKTASEQGVIISRPAEKRRSRP